MSMFVCLSVCLSAGRITPRLHGRSSPNFVCMLPVALAMGRSSSLR